MKNPQDYIDSLNDELPPENISIIVGVRNTPPKRFLIEMFLIFGDLADLQNLLRRIICFIFLI